MRLYEKVCDQEGLKQYGMLLAKLVLPGPISNNLKEISASLKLKDGTTN
jgi:hypothetical protein